MRKFLCSALIFGLSIISCQLFAQSEAYQTPVQSIKEVLDAKPAPTTVMGNSYKNMAVMQKNSSFLTLKDIANNEYRLAGVRMNPKNFSVKRQYYSNSMELIINENPVSLSGMPVNPKISTVKWSPSNKYIAFTNTTDTEIELWRVNTTTGVAEKINKYPLNETTLKTNMYNFIDDESILYAAVPENIGEIPSTEEIAKGPAVQEVYGKKFGGRTIADVITTPAEEDVFEYLTTSQMVIFSAEGTKKIAQKGIISSINLSPDNQYMMVRTVHKPYSYITAYSSFPHKMDLVKVSTGEVIKNLEDKTIKEEKGDKKTPKTPKPSGYSWRADQPATLYWSERVVSNDEDDDKDDKDVKKGKDSKEDKPEKTFQTNIYQQPAPFNGEKELILTPEFSYRGIVWGNDNFAIYTDASSKQKISRTLKFNPSNIKETPELLFTESTLPDTVDNYTVIGSPYTVKNNFGRKVLYLDKKPKVLYFTGSNRPDKENVRMSFIDKFDLKKKTFTQIWISEAPYLTSIVSIPNFKNLEVLVSRQSAKTPSNLALLNAKGDVKEITKFVDPVPAIRELGREFVTYKRKDGVDLTAILITPKGYDKERDGKLPVFMWAYPREYKTDVEAEKNNVHKYSFTTFNSAALMALEGYAVMLDMSMYIISEQKDSLPNDVFISELVSNAEAAIDFVDNYGVGDRNRVAVGGHSYGAFMTAHLLSQSDLFTAGVARSGAYNRTLTPFGFQSERRTYWEAPELYYKMSPFSYVNNLKEPILMIHGAIDENSGTFPVQSQRLYQAISYLGGTARYVVFPYETHSYRAIENNYQLWTETVNWLNKYTKNAKPKKDKKK